MTDIIFIHGMFQNPKSWDQWIERFSAKGFTCQAPAWPLHEGEPRDLRENPPRGLGDLRLRQIIDAIEERIASGAGLPILVGHSVGGLIVQILVNRGLAAAGVAVDSVAPNAMIELDWGFIKNSAIIANPLKGDEPILMDALTFHSAFANTMSETEALVEFDRTATHDSRNVLRDCMGDDGRVDLDRPHAPLLLIGGADDQIVPSSLTEKNFGAYTDKASIKEVEIFPGRSHYICNEPGWEQVADYALAFIETHVALSERYPSL